MSKRLRDNPAELSALITATGAAGGIDEEQVEKDFWLTEVLRAASVERYVALPSGEAVVVRCVFKGGTSLSRVFGIIERFSEDVDLLLEFPDGASANARHKILKQVDADVMGHLETGVESIDAGSTTGVKRYRQYRYPTGRRSGSLKDGVLMELGGRGGTSPSDVHSFQSMVAIHAISAFGDADDTWEEFAPFDVLVLGPERTLMEKVACVHSAAERGAVDELKKHGRHYYDIGRLLGTPIVTQALRGCDRIALIDHINARSEAAEFAWSPRPSGGYADSPAFDAAHPTHAAVAEGFAAAQDLIYGEPISLNDVLEVVKKHADIL